MDELKILVFCTSSLEDLFHSGKKVEISNKKKVSSLVRITVALNFGMGTFKTKSVLSVGCESLVLCYPECLTQQYHPHLFCIIGRSMGFEAGSGVRSMLAMEIVANFMTCESLSFLICKMGIMLIS